MAILFGILALACSLVGVLLFGIIGFGITVVFIALSILFVVLKKKKVGKLSVGGIIMSVLSFIISGLFTVGLYGISQTYKDEAKKYPGEYPLVEKYVDNLKYGAVGVIAKIDDPEGDAQKFVDELTALSDRVNEK